MGNLFIMAAIAAAIIILGVLLIVKMRRLKEKGETIKPDYRAIFFMGLTFVGSGVAIAASTENPGLYGISAMGLIYMIAGIANRDKWNNGTGE